MAHITEKAQKAAELARANGNRTILWVDRNDNTGEVRVYQKAILAGGTRQPTKRLTGKNIGRLMAEIDDAVTKGELTWTYNNAGALSWIRCWVEHLIPRCLCGAGRVGEEKNGFRHGKHYCAAIGTQEACRWPRPDERRVADRSDVFDPDPNETRRTPWEAI